MCQDEGQAWRLCAKWLCQMELLPPNHRVMMPDAEIQDLAYTLRDGVILCHVALAIDELSLDAKAINHRPQMAQFLCLKNIRIFLTAASRAFDLKDADLFEPSMLYDFTGFAQVLRTLSVLSNNAKVRAAKPFVEPWSHREPLETKETVKRSSLTDDPTEELYKNLECEADEATYEEFYYKHHGGNYAYVWGDAVQRSNNKRRNYAYLTYYADEEKEEEVYADLGLVRRPHHHRSHSAAGLLKDWKFEPKEKRDFCLVELLETEANYVDVLNKLRKNFIRPITTIREPDKKIIFMNIKELGDIHTAFFTALFNCVKEKPLANRRVGDVFIEFKEKFLKYADYCSGLTKAQVTLETLCAENKEVEKEIERCEKTANDKRILLRDMLAVPMQRVLKYHLLLNVMISSTPETHEDYRSYAGAHEAMIDVAEYINEAKRDSELIHNINVIQNSITALTMPDNTSLKDYGRLKKDGELKVQSHEQGTGTKHRQRYIFLFDNLILMSKSARDDTYKLKELLRVADYQVQDLTGSEGASSSSEVVRTASRRVLRRDSTRWTHAFLLVHVERSNAYTIFARTAEDKAKWMEAFGEAFHNAHLSDGDHGAGHDLHMSTFDKPTTCDVCFRLLKGLFYQGYKCAKCSRAVHQNCANGLAFCGPLQEPPALPPRPTSMQLPTVQNGSVDDGRDSGDEPLVLDRQGSNSSLVLAPPLAPLFSLAASSTYSSRTSHPDYINTRMEDHSWYVGEMDRETANSRLFPFPPGAFLVRCGRLGYALSLKTDQDVKHMKIDAQDNEAVCTDLLEPAAVADEAVASRSSFYFSENRKFNSVVELVSWYCRNSLKESFQGLDTVLQFPIGELSLVEAKYEFNPSDAANGGGNDVNLLTLRAGERVAVIDKLDDKGWWKAHNGGKIGYIPKTFVVQVN